MKKIYSSMMAIAIAAFTFTACEDVPEPYNNPYDSLKPDEPEEVIEPAGEGTAEAPYNVAAVIKACEGLADGSFLNDSKDIYVTGVVTETTEISTQYGNATYYISDNAKGSNRFYVYRGKLLDNADVKADTDLQVGDSVTVCGKIKNYKGTMEFDQGNYLTFYKKGEGGGAEQPDAPGTEEAPLTVAEALAYIDNLGADKQSPVGYVKGKIVAVSEISTSYGNATYTISDDGTDATTLQIYRGLGLGGEKFTSEDAIKAGDVVVVSGKLVNFKGNTKQFAQGSQIVELNGKKAEGGNETPTEGKGNGTADSPYDVNAAIAAASGTGVYVKGFIVGSISGKTLSDGATFSGTSEVNTNIMIAASADETDVAKCMPVQLPAGDVRAALNLQDNAGNYKKEVTLYGNIEKYFGATGIKSVSFAILNGTEIGTKPGNNTPSGEAKGSGTQADPWNVVAAINAINTNNIPNEAFVKGIIVQLDQFNDKYGSCTYWIADSKDATAKLQVYSGLNIGKAQFTSLDELSIGDEVVVAGVLKSYNGTPEFDKNNYIVSITKAGNNDTPSGTGSFENPLTASQAYDLVAAMENGVTSTEDYYVKGKITSIKYTFSANYGTATFNFSDDGTANGKEFIAYSTYYFGAEQKWVEGNTQVQVGDEVIVCGKVVNYGGNTPEFASKKSYIVKLNSQTAASRRH
jgi:RPA family protein